AHNSYVEIWAELGLAGLIAYLTLILAPLRSLRRFEFVTVGKRDERSKERYYISVGLQATLVATIVSGLFSSIQYQWFLYYPVALAVALTRMQGTEEMESPQ